MSIKTDFKSIGREELGQRLRDLDEPAYRADQILQWVYEKQAESFAAMSNLSAPLRKKLADSFTLDAVHANGEFAIKHILFPASSEAPMPHSRHDPETSVSRARADGARGGGPREVWSAVRRRRLERMAASRPQALRSNSQSRSCLWTEGAPTSGSRGGLQLAGRRMNGSD